ncbi:MAG: copper chaperone PCu(A)C [Hydrogenophaga sp.]|nr:copper chaperone PCu(A)C [Hydrogenophaga sp.]MDO8904237.1 copper chaperone PCu(A)C [Hydrogenophaga sp.]
MLIATLLAVTANAWAQGAATVTVKDAWVRATVAQQKATGAFMQLTAKADTKVVEASSSIAGVVEIHEMAMEKDVMRMRAMPALDLPAGKTVELKPGGYHVMLMDLKGPVKEGDVVSLLLVLEGKDGQRETLEVKAPVRALNAKTAKGDGHGGGHGPGPKH